MKVEIGGGTKPRQGYRNFDPMLDGEWGGRLGYDRIPASDGSVSAVYASHVLEHIPQGQPRVDALNEVWRVLRSGGEFEIVVPCVGYTDHLHLTHVPPRSTGSGDPKYAGWQAWGDPTHVSQWWFPESFWYLTEGSFKPNADYGLKPWLDGGMSLHDGWEAHVRLIKPTNGAA